MTHLGEDLTEAEAVETYISLASDCLERLDRAAVHTAVTRLHECYREGATVYAVGNGGSASTAQHFVADLGKYATYPYPGFRAIDLASNLAATTAWTNDEGWDNVYREFLRPWIGRNDVLVAFSVNGGSSRSRNLVHAMEQARQREATTIAVVGGDGGVLGEICDIAIQIPEPGPRFRTPLTESMHMVVHHLVVAVLRRRIAEA